MKIKLGIKWHYQNEILTHAKVSFLWRDRDLVKLLENATFGTQKRLEFIQTWEIIPTGFPSKGWTYSGLPLEVGGQSNVA